MKRKEFLLITILVFGMMAAPGTIFVDAHKDSVTLGGLFPLTGTLSGGGVEREAAFRIAVQEINQNDDILPNTELKYLIRDTATDATTGVTAAQELIDLGVVGLVGAASSTVSKAIGVVAAENQVPQISYSSTNPDLSDKTTYPYFLRVVPSDAEQGVALAKILKGLNITEVGTLATNDDYGQGGITVFETAAVAEGITVVESQSFDQGAPDVTAQLNALKGANVSTVVLNVIVGDAKTVFSQAGGASMGAADGIQWIGTDGPTQDQVFEGSADIKTAMANMLGTAPNRGSGEVYQHFLDLWECGDPDDYAGSGDRAPNTYATFAYDAVYAFAHALHNLKEDGESLTDGAKLLAELKALEFTGATGDVTFNDKQDRNGVYDLLNLKTEFTAVGIYDAKNGLKQFGNISYADGTTGINDGSTDPNAGVDPNRSGDCDGADGDVYDPHPSGNHSSDDDSPAPGIFISFLSLIVLVPILSRKLRN